MKRYLDQRLKLRHLRAITAIESQGSLLRASQVLGLTQPALTKSLGEIEDIVGVRCFDRHARGVTANDYGRMLVDAARQILNILREIDAGFDRIDGRQGGAIVVGALPTAASGVMPEVVRRLRHSNPDIIVRVIEDRMDELYAALALGDIDLIVGRLYDGGRDPNLIRQVLYDEPMSIVVGAGHPLARKTQVIAADLAQYEISLPIASQRIHAETQAFLQIYGIAACDGVTTTSKALLRELLLMNELITVVPRLMLAGDILRGALVVLRVDDSCVPPARPAGIVYRADRSLTPPAQALVAAVAAYATEVLARNVR